MMPDMTDARRESGHQGFRGRSRRNRKHLLYEDIPPAGLSRLPVSGPCVPRIAWLYPAGHVNRTSPATRHLAGGMSTCLELISPLEPDLSRQLPEAMAFSGGRGPLDTLP